MGSHAIIDPAELAAARRLASSPRARAIRERAGLSLADLAAGLGVSGAAVQRWECGSRRPSRDVALRYVALLDALAQQVEEDPIDATPPGSGAAQEVGRGAGVQYPV